MRLVFLSWAYPPMQYPRAAQVARLAAHVTYRPLEVFCLAPTGHAVEETYCAEDSITITRVPRSLPTRMLELLLPTARRRVLATPDAERFWWKRVTQYISCHRPLTSSDVLVTFGQPMADHLAGLRLKRRFGVRWIAHFSDPWADNPFASMGPRQRRSTLKRERSVIELADRVVFTSLDTVDLVMAKYPVAWRAKAAVIPHAFEVQANATVAPPTGPLMLRYLGNLFGERGPAPLYRALTVVNQRAPQLLNDLCIELIGDISPQFQRDADFGKLAQKLVSVLPKVDYASSLKLMRSADLLLNIDAPFEHSVFLPSKLVDYIGAHRPILGITPPGAASRLIGELGGWTADPRDPGGIADALITAVTYVSPRRGEPWGCEAVRRRFEASCVAARFEQLAGLP